VQFGVSAIAVEKYLQLRR